MTGVSKENNRTMSNIILSFKELNKLKDTIYATEVAHGFHDEKHTVDHELGMVLSEIGEAIDADRNPNAPVPTQKTIDEALELAEKPDEQHVAFIAYFKDHIKGSVVEELADVAIRLLDLAGSMDVEFDEQSNLEGTILASDDTLPDQLFGFSLGLGSLTFDFADGIEFADALQDITRIAKDYTHLDLWQVVRLKMLYNDMRPWLNGKKY